MNRQITLTIRYIAIYFLLSIASLFSNDTKVTVASGGIVFEDKESDIEMISEILEISTKKIRVVYDFFNHGPTKVISVGFPLPRSPYNMDSMYPYSTWDEAQIALRTLYGDDGEPHAGLDFYLKNPEIINFSVLVNDHPTRFTRYMQAFDLKGNDITDLLRKYRIPISSAYLRGFMEEPPMNLLPGLKETLKMLNLLDSKELPNWYLQTTYVWKQEFLANKNTHVEHSYTPSSGEYWTNVEEFINKRKVNRYHGTDDIVSVDLEKCTFDPQHLEEFLERLKQDSKKHKLNQRIHEIQYILKTGSNWHGSIKKFHLEITPKKPTDLIILEGKYPMKRKNNGICVVDIENFKPADNLRIWILPTAYGFDDDQEQDDLKQSFTIWGKIKKLWPF